MSKRYSDPTTPQGQLDLGPFDLTAVPLKLMGITLIFDCPRPLRLGQDQYRCATCSLVWDIDEAKPPCNRTDIHPENRT